MRKRQLGEWIAGAVLLVIVGAAVMSMVVILAEDARDRYRELDCNTAGYIEMVRVGDVHLCVDVQPDGEYVAVPLETVRSRLGE